MACNRLPRVMKHYCATGRRNYGRYFEETSAEMKYMRITAGYTLDRLQNKYTNCKGIKNNTNSRQITGIQEKLDTTCK